MAEISKISWTDATFNGWIGCTKVNSLCDFCYAELQNSYRKWNGGVWGPGALRKLTTETYWRAPLDWNKQAATEKRRIKVFAFSLADVFDVEGPIWPENRRWPGERTLIDHGDNVPAVNVFFNGLVRQTPNLDWIVLTKRYERARWYLDRLWGRAPWPNVWIVFSAGTQELLDHAMREMTQISAVVRGISAEPLLGPMNFKPYLDGLDWVIVGGESGPRAREMKPQWEQPIRFDVTTAGKAYFLKQLGQRWLRGDESIWSHKWDEPAEWPETMRIQQFPVPRILQLV